MEVPIVLLLAHDGNRQSEHMFNRLKERAGLSNEEEEGEEPCSFAFIVRPEVHPNSLTNEEEEATNTEMERDVFDIVADTITRHLESEMSVEALLLDGYPSDLAELGQLVDKGMIDGVLTVTCNDTGLEIRSSDKPKPATAADRVMAISAPHQIDDDNRFIQDIPPEQLPAVVNWSALIKSHLKYGGNWLNLTVDELNTREWDEGLGAMLNVEEGKFEESFDQLLQELHKLKADYRGWNLQAKLYDVVREPRHSNNEGATDDGEDQTDAAIAMTTIDAETSSHLVTGELFGMYNDLLQKVPTVACTESIVVCAIVAAVTHSDELIPVCSSARAGSLSDWNNRWGIHELPCTLEAADGIATRITRIDAWVAAAARFASLGNLDGNARLGSLSPHNWSEYMIAARLQAQIPRLFGHLAMPIHDTMDEEARGLVETELVSFAKVPSSFIHRCRFLETFDRMMETLAANESLSARSMYQWKASKFRFHRHLSASVFQQILASEIRKYPLILREYDDVADQLLVALMWRPISGRLSRTKHRLRDFVRQRTSYEEYVAYHYRNLTPRTITALQSTLSSSNENGLLDMVIEMVQLFPSDHSIVTITGGDVKSLLTIDYKHYTLGLRRQAPSADALLGDYCFVCEANDDVRLTVGIGKSALDEAHNANLIYTAPEGYQMRFDIDGTVRIMFDGQDPQDVLLSGAARMEHQRLIHPSGEVIRFCRDGTQQVLKPHGEIVTYSGSNNENETRWREIQIIRAAGIDSSWNAGTEQWCHSSETSYVQHGKDISTRANFTSRPNGLVHIRFVDGCTISRFCDGTIIRSAPDGEENKLRFIECPELPSIEMNTNMSALAPKETRTCARCALPDGTKVQLLAKYVGVSRTERTLVLERKDGTKLRISESGAVTASFQTSSNVWDGNSSNMQESSTTYEFDLLAGKFSLEDSESNFFEVDLEDALHPRIQLAGSVDGVRAKPLISDPIPPRFFVMQRNGDATEWLSTVQSPIVDNSNDLATNVSPRSSTDIKKTFEQSNTSTQVMTSFETIPTDKCQFQDLWLALDWEIRQIPVAAKCHFNEPLAVSPNMPVLYIRTVIMQLDPIDEDYLRQVRAGVTRWREWKTSRVARATRVLEDARSVDEKDLEATLQKQLRKLYKSIRASARQEKRQAQEAMLRHAAEEVTHGIDDEGLNADSVESDTSSLAGDEPVMDEEEIEILAAFDSAVPDGCSEISFDGLRQAIVQTLGRGIARAELENAVHSVLRSSSDPLQFQYDLEAFRNIYKLLGAIVTEGQENNLYENSSKISAQGTPVCLGQAADSQSATPALEGSTSRILGQAVTQVRAPLDNLGKLDETRPPVRPAVGSGRNAVLAATQVCRQR